MILKFKSITIKFLQQKQRASGHEDYGPWWLKDRQFPVPESCLLWRGHILLCHCRLARRLLRFFVKVWAFSHEINSNPKLPKNMHQIKTFLLIGSDLMWTLYGFLKNLPDKNATVDSFIDYSIHFYHQELLRLVMLEARD